MPILLHLSRRAGEFGRRPGEDSRLRVATLLMALVAASGCSSVEPWVKPYERQNFADIIMAAERDPVAAAYLNHVFEAREGARGASGSHGGGCGCN
jgi:hypothetical protein